ncbi:uncharacterized protein BX663DRAFT_503601 [Cokeromyces recurvatus]|uniref:uncharacterized protein n=1 Tax=Cokeromyces recurvatus TaxID=90255 RepID=UPI002220FAC2|nr:uncharacterized protein BX663DRAFT_503601 [Cokeromyces recurvatus]KAI7904807.1 hypothetical protein BX663DRAFT_503601 [Cokeromyces recurvatus]
MIPRLPPVVLALLGGASIYGIKYVLDKIEPKAIGPPGSSEQMSRVLNYRRNVRRIGVAVAVSGIIYTGYWAYDLRKHRNSPAVIAKNNLDEQKAFYEDQYREREKRYIKEIEELKRKEKDKELFIKQHLDKEVLAMENMINQQNESNNNNKK